MACFWDVQSQLALTMSFGAAGDTDAAHSQMSDVSPGGLLSGLLWAPRVLSDMSTIPFIWWPQVLHDRLIGDNALWCILASVCEASGN